MWSKSIWRLKPTTFSVSELVYVLDKEIILSHVLVPRHEVMSKEETEVVLAKYGIITDQLPRITEEDPVAKNIGAKKGDVLKITRRSHTAGEALYYRVVV